MQYWDVQHSTQHADSHRPWLCRINVQLDKPAKSGVSRNQRLLRLGSKIALVLLGFTQNNAQIPASTATEKLTVTQRSRVGV